MYIHSMSGPLMDLPCLAANLRRADRAVGRLYGSEIRKRPHWERAQARLREAFGSEEWSALLERIVEVTHAAEAA